MARDIFESEKLRVDIPTMPIKLANTKFSGRAPAGDIHCGAFLTYQFYSLIYEIRVLMLFFNFWNPIIEEELQCIPCLMSRIAICDDHTVYSMRTAIMRNT